jgi:glutamate-ammonia-ligase adenylyltransferase
LTSTSTAEIVKHGLEANASPDLALTNLERWLRATSSPGLYAEQLAANPYLGRLLLDIFGASQPIADVLIQNPELSSLILEPGELERYPDVETLVSDGKRLLAATSSYAHALDRLRFLRQRWMLTITLNDLGGRWPQERVWRALSDLADALVALVVERAYEETRKSRPLPEKCPVMVVAFGKLGGRELNYSSDIDLAYVIEDGLDEKTERECVRFCEALGRALSDRMGRGALYRIDLRLRPYGAAGPILRSMKGYEGYYNRYAEHWEIQALLRSRPLVGPFAICDRWEKLRIEKCFRPKTSEIALEEMYSMRARIEEYAAPGDIKRGAGGIRDVEFLVQALQMLHGAGVPALQVRPTIDALRALEEAGYLDHSVAAALKEGYTFLRKLEHRVQLVGDQQTHELPASDVSREALARTMGERSWSALESNLRFHRRTIESLYRSTLNLDPEARDPRNRVAQELGHLGPAALQWFDVLAESESFYSQLEENQGSLLRVRQILETAPRLVNRFKESVPATELLLSGEIEEAGDDSGRLSRLPRESDPATVASVYTDGVTKSLARWILNPEERPEPTICLLGEALLNRAIAEYAPSATLIGLGSFGNRECSLDSDLDLLFLVEDPSAHAATEKGVQDLLGYIGRLRQFGTGLNVDLRLRPDGRRGLLVRTLQGLQAYAQSDLELWERFALGHARLIHGSQDAFDVVLELAYGLPITPDRLQELLRMKHRVETERVKPQHLQRNVKLGNGGLNDLEWLVHLHEMRYPGATGADGGGPFDERIRRLFRAQLINALETEFLLSARTHLLDLRLRLQMLGYEEDLVPENPDKLDRLARSFGEVDGNAFLARHEPVIDGVRRLYNESIERLLH